MPVKTPRGNYPLIDDNDYIHAVLTGVKYLTRKDKYRQREWQAWVWTFECPGLLRPFEFTEDTGLTTHPPDKQGHLDRCSTLLVRLGATSVEGLRNDTPTGQHLQALVGRRVIFKMYCKDARYHVNFETLALGTPA